MIKFINTSVKIDNMQINDYITKNRAAIAKASTGNASARRLVLRYLSDFIATEKLFKHNPTSNFSKFKDAPDITGTVKDFKDIFGFSATGTEKSGAVAQVKEVTNNTKNITITSNTLSADQLASFTDNADKDVPISKISSDKLVAFIKSNPALRKSVEKQIVQKFENFVVIDYKDKKKNATPTVYALGNASNKLFTGIDILSSKNLTVVARQDKTSSNLGVSFDYKLSKVGYSLFFKNATDITIKFHSILANNISQRFMQEAIQRHIVSKSKQNSINFIAALYSTAKEFEKTPIIYETIIKKPKQGLISTNFSAKTPSKQTQPSTQQFISAIQLTMLVQKRLGATMGKGAPNPPWLKERTGRFKESVKTFPNYKTNSVNYMYMPLYDANIKFGYDPDEQVKKSIREVLQTIYTRQFNLVRG